MAVVAVDGGDELRSVAACEKQRRGGRSKESEREPGAAWRSVASSRRGRGSRRWPGQRRRPPRTCSSSWQRRKMTRGALGWAGQMGWPAGLRQVSPGKCSVLFSLCFIFLNLFCHCFEFKNNSNNAKNSSEYFCFARWTFPKAHKIFQGYLKLYSNYMNIIQIQIANDLNSKSQK